MLPPGRDKALTNPHTCVQLPTDVRGGGNEDCQVFEPTGGLLALVGGGAAAEKSAL